MLSRSVESIGSNGLDPSSSLFLRQGFKMICNRVHHFIQDLVVFAFRLRCHCLSSEPCIAHPLTLADIFTLQCPKG